MNRALFITELFETFTSDWGSLAIPQPYLDGWIMPIGWEDELIKRGIDFTEIEITPQEPTNEP